MGSGLICGKRSKWDFVVVHRLDLDRRGRLVLVQGLDLERKEGVTGGLGLADPSGELVFGAVDVHFSAVIGLFVGLFLVAEENSAVGVVVGH